MIELQNKIGNRHCKYLKIIIKEIALRNFGTFLIPQPHVHCSSIYEGGNLESLFLQRRKNQIYFHSNYLKK